MIIFIRKHQRLFFGFIAAVVICSMLFFGTFSVLSNDPTPVDPVIGQTLDGASFRLSEVKAIARFIQADREDKVPNLCNDGIVRHDLFETGLAHLLAADYLDPLKKGLETRLDRAKKFRTYAHPQIAGLTAQAVWERFLPSMNHDLALLQQHSEANLKAFSLFVELYAHQKKFSPDTLRHILQMQERQYGIAPDFKLNQGDLALFGFHSLNDWFGSDFLDLSAQFILNGASLAEQKGYRVSLEEAKGSLTVIFEDSLRKQSQLGVKTLPSLTQHLRSLGFDLNKAAAVWRKILLFRRYFQGISQAAFIDRLPFTDFASYAKETAVVDLYRWPSALRLKNFNDLIEFQVYLSAISLPSKDPLALPSAVLPQETVESRFPELVPALYKAKIGELSLQEAALIAPIKEVWDWECEEKNWQKLQARFPFINSAATRREQFQILGALSPKNRQEVDSFARISLLQDHPEWISAALNSVPLRDRTIALAEGLAPLPHVDKIENFSELLLQASNGDERAELTLLSYSDDGKTAYRLEEIKALPRAILTFSEAKERGILTHLADRILEAQYLKIRGSSPERFQDKQGNWKSFYDVKETVAKLFFSPVLKAISSLEKKEWTGEDYAVYRLLAPAQIALEDLKKNGDCSQWLQTEGDPLIQQFKLERKKTEIQRTGQEEWMKNLSFMMIPNEWSPIQVPPSGEISFFYLSQKRLPEAPILEQIAFGQELIGADAERYVAERVLKSIKTKKSIVLPLQGELE